MDLSIFIGIFLFLVPFLVIMVVESRKRRGPETEEVDEEAGGSQMGENPSEEDVEEGEHEGRHKLGVGVGRELAALVLVAQEVADEGEQRAGRLDGDVQP